VTSEAGIPGSTSRGAALQVAVMVLVLLFVFLVGIKGMGDGFKLLGQDVLGTFFRATSNPFMGLIVGILATTLVQSSSVSTSMIVGLVASPESPLPIANAIPMVMGANIGTSVTNTIVSLGHIAHPNEYRRAFAAATVHDFFNLVCVLLLLPLEIATGYLHWVATLATELFSGVGGMTFSSPLKLVTKPAVNFLLDLGKASGFRTDGLYHFGKPAYGHLSCLLRHRGSTGL